MNRGQGHLLVGSEASMLADLAHLTPEPTGLGMLLSQLGYSPRPFGNGLFAPGLQMPGGRPLPAILLPAYTGAALAVRKGALVGRNVARSGAAAALLAALRSMAQRPAILFLAEPHSAPLQIRADQIVSLEGGVVPRLWHRCFGSFDVLARITGQHAHPGLTNTAINAIELSVPIQQALLHLKADLQSRSLRWGHYADGPLQPRLTFSAAHGGSRGSVLPAVFDLLLTRRYDPAETMNEALDEIRLVIEAAAPRSLQIDLSVTQHDPALPDPAEADRSWEERALASGWGWPQTRFLTVSRLVPGAVVFGGLERPDQDRDADDAMTTLEAMNALARSIHALVQDA